MNQKQPFNAELYFANPQAWTLETRGGVKINKKDLKDNKTTTSKKYPNYKIQG